MYDRQAVSHQTAATALVKFLKPWGQEFSSVVQAGKRAQRGKKDCELMALTWRMRHPMAAVGGVGVRLVPPLMRVYG